MKIISVISITIVGLLAAVSVTAEALVDTNGNLRVPADYRTAYQSLGSWAVAAEKGQGSKEIHVVYALPGTIAAYRKDGHFPDGSVLVKEVFQADTGEMTTGTVSHAQTLKGWFVMMKDSKDSHPGNKLWGNGWGWSWLTLQKPRRRTTKWIVYPAMSQRELPIGFMSKDIPH